MEEVAETPAHLPVSIESDKPEETETTPEVNSFEEKEPQKVAEPEPQPEPQGRRFVLENCAYWMVRLKLCFSDVKLLVT